MHFASPTSREPTPLLVVISGPSGVGKDTVVKRLQELGYPFHFVVTATTRPMRPGEVHGKDYFFVSREEFDRMIAEGELLEYALVYGEYKGVPKSQIREALASGKDVIMRLDVQGAETIRQLAPEAILIFLTASEDELLQRLHRRHTESPEALQRRIATAQEEMRHVENFDYIVVNREYHLDQTIETILAIMTAEKCRVHPRKVNL